MNEQRSLWDDHVYPSDPNAVARPTGVSFDGRPIRHINPDWYKLVRTSDPETSRQAAQKVVPRISRTKQIVVDCLSLHPQGLCDEQIARLTKLKESSASKRRGELVTDGLVKYAGHTRLTSTGSPAKVWVLA